MGSNGVVIVIGVLTTAPVNRDMFKNNERDFGSSRVFWAAFEQPLVS